MPPDTICAVATPSGEGAVGVIRVSGPRALELTARLCPGQTLEPRVQHLVRLRRPGRAPAEILDQVLLCYMPGPRSYTGEDVVEVCGHGGILNLERLLSAFIELGGRLAEPGEFTKRAFINGRIDLTQAESIAQIVSARSERALQNAHAALAGALGSRVAEIRSKIVSMAATLESSVDFCEDLTPEEDIHKRVAALAAQVTGQLDALIETYRHGRLLGGATVVLVGPVNAGKSTLFNRLLDVDRALVSKEPGTTRDYLEAEVQWKGQRVTLVDTAGDRPPDQQTPLERTGRELAARVIDRSDVRIYVVDLSGDDLNAALIRRPEGALVVGNKVDRLPDASRVPQEVDHAVSAIDGTGLKELERMLLERLVPEPEQTETVLVSRRRQWEALRAARDNLSEGVQAAEQGMVPELVVEHVNAALRNLETLTGESRDEAVLEAIFEEFCIGK